MAVQKSVYIMRVYERETGAELDMSMRVYSSMKKAIEGAELHLKYSHREEIGRVRKLAYTGYVYGTEHHAKIERENLY